MDQSALDQVAVTNRDFTSTRLTTRTHLLIPAPHPLLDRQVVRHAACGWSAPPLRPASAPCVSLAAAGEPPSSSPKTNVRHRRQASSPGRTLVLGDEDG